ncbi:uncharacterized protein B0P05DRAFT_583047 [Gilbertella persicaria]|uniref:uncharacterized protein n=1 Tax=Gilbertella persicaria TaxID=101096 RepID=UPI00221F2A15|nr:uncharacterized protein B0P05DRAFT_583047 [Gilbertella persicaria]KAI8098076.1 hypothetical protein B0P05DRAFT_583047 [Gilbertella persicaria]
MPPKADVRKLLKKQQQERSKAKRIDHPFAKYDSMDRLMCIVCHSPIKSEAVWPAHLASAGHRDNIQKLKALKQQQQQQQQLKRRASTPPSQTENDTQEHKRMRVDEDDTQDIELEDASDEDDMKLPNDFFDQQQQEEPVEEPAEETVEESVDNNTLPAGFFDDPEEEARVQGTLPPEEQAQVDLDRDLQEFNEAMIEVTKESREVQEEDDETFWRERNYEIFQEQAMFDSRVEKLKQLRKTGETKMQVDQPDHDELKTSVRHILVSKPTKQEASMFDDDDESGSEEEDWRAQQL